ncbi:hypothetical protein BDN72DRAFT_859686 [Pluteus cervinus]|uniref:Uncharacterized protein n=1 Tax=Pluteus cervinus TaxID=181527 RepID=A0ACD3AMJ0_9AGAR|nr:hypothetical protein BDN72DRAFT_859686 [Pluteus cervinus]
MTFVWLTAFASPRHSDHPPPHPLQSLAFSSHPKKRTPFYSIPFHQFIGLRVIRIRFESHLLIHISRGLHEDNFSRFRFKKYMWREVGENGRSDDEFNIVSTSGRDVVVQGFNQGTIRHSRNRRYRLWWQDRGDGWLGEFAIGERHYGDWSGGGDSMAETEGWAGVIGWGCGDGSLKEENSKGGCIRFCSADKSFVSGHQRCPPLTASASEATAGLSKELWFEGMGVVVVGDVGVHGRDFGEMELEVEKVFTADPLQFPWVGFLQAEWDVVLAAVGCLVFLVRVVATKEAIWSGVGRIRPLCTQLERVILPSLCPHWVP